MSKDTPLLRHLAAALASASATLLALESVRPGTVSTQVPLAAVVLGAVAGVGLYAGLPPAGRFRTSAWHLLLLGWLAAAVGWCVLVALRNATTYSLPLGCLAAGAAWAGLLALALRKPSS